MGSAPVSGVGFGVSPKLFYARIREVLCSWKLPTQEPGILLSLPITLHLLDPHRLRLKINPLRPATALSEDAYAGHAIQQYALVADLATRRLLNPNLSCPLEPVHPIRLASVVRTNALHV